MNLKPRRELGAIIKYLVGIVLAFVLIFVSIWALINGTGTALISITSFALAALLIVIYGLNLVILKYTLNEQEGSIKVVTGLIKETFYIKDIVEIKDTKSFMPQGTCAKEKLEITYSFQSPKGNGVRQIYMATTDDKAFIAYLKSKNRNIKYINKEMAKRIVHTRHY